MSTNISPVKWCGKTHSQLSAEEWNTIKGADFELYHQLIQDSIRKPEPAPTPQPEPAPVVAQYVTHAELKNAEHALVDGITQAIGSALKKQILRVNSLEEKTSTVASASVVAECQEKIAALEKKQHSGLFAEYDKRMGVMSARLDKLTQLNSALTKEIAALTRKVSEI